MDNSYQNGSQVCGNATKTTSFDSPTCTVDPGHVFIDPPGFVFKKLPISLEIHYNRGNTAIIHVRNAPNSAKMHSKQSWSMPHYADSESAPCSYQSLQISFKE